MTASPGPLSIAAGSACGHRWTVSRGDPVREPGLELQPPDLPEALHDRRPLALRQAAEPAARLAGAGEQVVHERPVGGRELRRGVAVDDVDARGARLGQQRRPLERALAAAEDQAAAVAQAGELDRAGGVRPLPGREPVAHQRRLDGEVRDARRGDDAVGEDRAAVLHPRLEARRVAAHEGADPLPARLDPLLGREPVRVADEDADRDRVDGRRGRAPARRHRPPACARRRRRGASRGRSAAASRPACCAARTPSARRARRWGCRAGGPRPRSPAHRARPR